MTPLRFEDLKPSNGIVVGEIACGHEGDLGKFKLLVDAVAQSGAAAVKFQIFTPLERVTEGHPEWDIFHKLTINAKGWAEITAYARSKGLTIFSDVFGQEGLAIAQSVNVDGYKIHSEDLLNTFFIEQVARLNKILMIGVGGAHRIEVYSLLKYLTSKDLCHQVVLMNGAQTFPTPLEAHSLQEVEDLIAKYGQFGVKVGFADHVSGELPQAKLLPLMALSAGACLIEKHVTIDRAQQWEDYQSALSAADFKDFVASVKQMAPMMAPIGSLNSYEIKYRKQFKKSPLAVRPIKAGQVIVPDDFTFSKKADVSLPLSGLQIAGAKAKEDIAPGSLIKTSKLQHKVAGILVARCSSNRLPSKATRKILGRETIALLIERLKRCHNLDCIILATSTDPSDDVLEAMARREGVLPFRGSLEDLSLRFYEAAKHYGATQIVRITGDDIIRDELMIDKAVASHMENSSEVTFMNKMPYGTSSEVFSLNALETILNTVNVPSNTEYLEWFLQNNRYFSVNYVEPGYTYDPAIRLTLDYEEDFVFFSKIFEHFYQKKPDFTLPDVLAYLKEHPEVVAINSFKTAKYTSKDLDITLRI